MIRFSVLGCGLYTPHFPTLDAWRSAERSDAAVPPKGVALDRRSRRISGALMRALTDVAHEALHAANADPSTIPSVYGSALGEVQTMMKLLKQIWVDKDPPSPMAFAASVHNAAAGVASISFKNQGFTTSVAANFDTPAMSLFEGVGLLKTGSPHALIVCGDEPSPDALMGEHPTWDTLCAALVLSADAAHPERIATISLPTQRPPKELDNVPSAALDAKLQSNPSVGMLRLVDAIARQHAGVVSLDEGRGRGWKVCVEPA